MLSPGLLTTVQDLGRPGYAQFGISAAGAADALALRAGNLLVGNPENAPALEMTLAGASFEFEDAGWVALCGGDFETSLPLWTAVAVEPGTVMRCGRARAGARLYLCVRGGIDVPTVLGSASTHLLTGIGGKEGRALRKHDVLRIGGAAIRKPRLKAPLRAPSGNAGVLRVTPGPQAEWFGADDFYGSEYEVGADSNRMGLRLRGARVDWAGKEMITEGVALGAVQVPPEGQPIILFVEHQTTGGYPKISNVISADLTCVGQLRPRDRLRFERVTFERARDLLREQEAWLYELV